MTWFRVGGTGIPVSLKNRMNAVLNKKFGTSGQNYPPNGWPDDVNLLGPLPEKTVAGAIAHTDDAADTVPVNSVICSIVPKQAGTGTPSPSNVRALSGYTGMNLYKTGQNLLDMTVYDGGSYNPAVGTTITLSLSASQFTKTGNAYTIDTTTSWETLSVRMPIKSGVTYYRKFTMSASGTNLGSSEYYLDADNKVIGSVSNNTDNPHTKTGTLSIPSGAVWFVVTFTNRSTATNTLTIADPQIAVSSSELTYEDYTGETISDSWSSIGQIYGGERDLTLGSLTVKFGVAVIDGVNIYGYLTGAGSMNILPNGAIDAYTPFNSTTAALWKCDKYEINMTNCGYNATYKFLFFRSGIWEQTGATTEAEFNAYCQQNPIVVVYPLREESYITYTNLDKYDFETLYAVNNFFSDIEGGQTQLTYRQDIALALAALQNSRSLSASLMRSAGPDLEERSEDPEEVSETEENIQNTEEQEGENDER